MAWLWARVSRDQLLPVDKGNRVLLRDIWHKGINTGPALIQTTNTVSASCPGWQCCCAGKWSPIIHFNGTTTLAEQRCKCHEVFLFTLLSLRLQWWIISLYYKPLSVFSVNLYSHGSFSQIVVVPSSVNTWLIATSPHTTQLLAFSEITIYTIPQFLLIVILNQIQTDIL